MKYEKGKPLTKQEQEQKDKERYKLTISRIVFLVGLQATQHNEERSETIKRLQKQKSLYESFGWNLL